MRPTAKSVVAASLLALVAGGCGGSSVAADRVDPVAASPPTLLGDCASSAQQVREETLARGLPDGEARRAADQAGSASEDDLSSRSPDLPAPSACAPAGRKIDAVAEVPRSPKPARIYRSCTTEASPLGLPVYGFPVTVADGSQPTAAKVVVERYFDGIPTGSGYDGEYATVLGSDADAYLAGVTVADGLVTIDFSDRLRQHPALGATAFDDVLATELSATALQFVNAVQFTISGSCEAFAVAVNWSSQCPPPVSRDRPPVSVGAEVGANT